MVENLKSDRFGLKVWFHYFNWNYFRPLDSPWFSALAQGQGISLLSRAYLETKNEKYLQIASDAFSAFLEDISRGGVSYRDEENNLWLEEYIVYPPTHILNGFIWACWGVRDYWLLTKDKLAENIYQECLKTLEKNLKKFDIGFWSLYDLAPTKLKSLASLFYHSLHIVQLKIMYLITKNSLFYNYALKWGKYKKNWLYRNSALIYKAIFKILYY